MKVSKYVFREPTVADFKAAGFKVIGMVVGGGQVLLIWEDGYTPTNQEVDKAMDLWTKPIKEKRVLTEEEKKHVSIVVRKEIGEIEEA